MAILIRAIAVAVLGACLVLLAASLSHAATCQEVVRPHPPEAFRVWPVRPVAHHLKCSTGRKVMRIAQHGQTRIDIRPRLDVRRAGAVPLPRPRCDRECQTVNFYRDIMGWTDEMIMIIWPELISPP
jgi:hypothetical protein